MKNIEGFLNENKHILNLFGILIALGVLIYSGYNSRLAYKALDFSYKTYQESNIPLFEFTINRKQNNIDYEYLSVIPKDENVSLNRASIYFFLSDKKDTFELKVPKEFNLRELKEKVSTELNQFYCDDCYYYSEYTCIPVGIIFEYFQYGEKKELLGLFKLTCKIYLYGNILKTSLRNIEFLKYYENKKESTVWMDIESSAYDFCYKNHLKNNYVEEKILDKVKNEHNLKEAYAIYNLLNTYRQEKIIYQNIDSTITYVLYNFLFNDSAKLEFQELLLNSQTTERKLKRVNNNVSEDYKKLIEYVSKLEMPTETSWDILLNSNWVDKRVMDSIYFLKSNLKNSMIESIKYSP